MPVPAVQRDASYLAPALGDDANEIASRISRSRGQGAPLPEDVRGRLEPSLGGHLADVRIHTDGEAHDLSRALSARAFTTGSDIYFQRGLYQPATQTGMGLLTHEAAHVLQQRAGPVPGRDWGGGLRVSEPGDAGERGADAAVTTGDEGLHASVREGHDTCLPSMGAPSTGHNIQRAEEEAENIKEDAPDESGLRLGELTVTTYGEAYTFVSVHILSLEQTRDSRLASGASCPDPVWATLESGKALRKELGGYLEAEAGDDLPQWASEALVKWYDAYGRAQNAVVKADAKEAEEATLELVERLQDMESHRVRDILPTLRQTQMRMFYADDHGKLRSLGDAINNIVSVGTTSESVIDQLDSLGTELGAFAKPGSKVAHRVSGATTKAVKIASELSKIYGYLTLAVDSVAVVAGAPGPDKSKRAVGVIGATWSLLDTTSLFSLYSTLYLGPMMDTCLSLVEQLRQGAREDVLEAGDIINLNDPKSVNWSLFRGGLETYEFMTKVMRAESATAVPKPAPDQFIQLLRDFTGSLDAGLPKGREVPTGGIPILWETIQTDRVPNWVFQNRRSLWAMLYGKAQPQPPNP